MSSDAFINNEDSDIDDDVALPKLKSIWDCHQINKGLVPSPDGTSVSGWTCSWCPGGGRSFKGDNATKALAHVAKIPGKNVKFCTGNIPRNKVIQYRNLWMEKSSAKSERSARSEVLDNGISNIQSRAIAAMGGRDIDDTRDEMFIDPEPTQKRIHDFTVASGSSVGSITTSSTTLSKKARASGKQMKLCGNAVDPDAPERMHMAIADFIHSNCLPFSLAEDPKFLKLLQVGKSLGMYKPPNRRLIAGKYLDALHELNWKEQMKTLLSEAATFGITVFGDGATIKTIPLLNVLAAGVNNSFALLDIADCTDHLALGGKKDASHIASIIKPLIATLEGELDEHNRKCTGIVDLVFFDGASNVQNTGELLRVKYPRITVGHGAEHVVSLFFKDVYEKVINACIYLFLF